MNKIENTSNDNFDLYVKVFEDPKTFDSDTVLTTLRLMLDDYKVDPHANWEKFYLTGYIANGKLSLTLGIEWKKEDEECPA